MDNYETDVQNVNKLKQFKLYVHNLPPELNVYGLKEIFIEYGNIVGFYMKPGVSWAFVTFSKYQDAEHAVRELHNKPPLHLQVSFAKQKKTNAKPNLNAPKQNECHTYQQKGLQNSKESSPKTTAQSTKPDNTMKFLKDKLSKASEHVQNCTPTDDLLYPVPVDSNVYNPYEEAEPYASTNRMWTRGQLTITKDGKRHVSFGRGYTWYQIPDPHPNVEQYLSKVHEMRTAGLYKYKEDTLKHSIGRCLVCRKLTKQICQRCSAFYCGTECQLDDWPHHKTTCQSMPPLVKTTSTSSSEYRSEQQALRRISNDLERKLRTPKLFVENKRVQVSPAATKTEKEISSRGLDCETSFKYLTEPNAIYASHKKDQSVHQRDSISRERRQSSSSSNSPGKRITTPHKKIDSDVRSQSDTPRSSSKNSLHSCEFAAQDEIVNTKVNRSLTRVENSEDDVAYQLNDTFLSSTAFTEVRVLRRCRDKDYTAYWVRRVDQISAFSAMRAKLNEAMPKASTPITVKRGTLYATLVDSEWYRIMTPTGSSETVLFVDYGFYDYSGETMRILGTLDLHPHFARKIRLPECASVKWKSLEMNDKLSVRMISVDLEGVISVEVKDEEKESGEVQSQKPAVKCAKSVEDSNASLTNVELRAEKKKDTSVRTRLPNIGSYCDVGMKGYIKVHGMLGSNSYSITILSNEIPVALDGVVELPQVCANTTVSADFKPEINTLVCGQTERGDWSRGYIFHLGPPIQLAAVDRAKIILVEKVIPYPEQFMDLPTLGAVCKLLDMDDELELRELYPCTIVEHRKDENDEDVVNINIISKGKNLTGIFTPWKPAPEQSGVSLAELESGSKVCIASYRSPNLLYVNSLEPMAVEHFHRVMQGVTKWAQTAPIVEKPVIGQMVIALFADSNYYRAVVTDVSDKGVTISYVDFGNVECTTISKLRVLSEELKSLSSCATKIALKLVPKNSVMTQDASNYLKNLVGKKVPLFCKFNGVPSEDGVYLKTVNGENVNEQFVKYLTPSYDRGEEEDKTCYGIDDMTACILGNVGDSFDAIVLHVISPGAEYSLCRKNLDLLEHIVHTMQPQINEYCKSTSYYVPRINESCLALFENDWYRALCLSLTEDSANVLFIDFGNMESIKHENMRLMPKDFLTTEILANCCIIVGPDGKPYSEKEQEVVAKFIALDKVIKIKIIKADVEGVYTVEIPDIHFMLKFDSD